MPNSYSHRSVVAYRASLSSNEAVWIGRFISGGTVSKVIPMTGRTFGRLTVVGLYDIRDNQRRYMCKCVCGNETVVYGSNLRGGTTKSCSCLTKEPYIRGRMTHGLKNNRSYNTWVAMIARCSDARNADYRDYGGRGIKVCNRWRDSVIAFVEDMGERPRGMSIDRIDNNGDYTPTNCRWGTAGEQSRNKRNTITVMYGGESKCLKDWALDKRSVVKYTTLYARITKHGWDIGAALTTPPRTIKRMEQR